MTCHEARERILECLDPAAGGHCANCAEFYREQCQIDAALAARFASVALPAARLSKIRNEVRARRRQARWEMAPELLHYVGAAGAGLLMALVVPSVSWTAAMAAAAISCLIHSLLRGWIEDS